MRPAAGTPRPPGPAAPELATPWPWVPPLAAAAAAGLVFHRALTFYFSQDDFLGLARASGLAPRLTGAWRYLSHQAFFDLMRRVAGLDAGPYHAASLVVHAAGAALLARFLARVVSRPAALLGAVFFAVHPSHFGSVYWISAIGDELALLGALAALLLALDGGRRGWTALPVFALSLLAKESTLLLPAAVALAARPLRSRVPRGLLAGLAALALVHLATLTAGDAFGVRRGLPGEAAYATGLGGHVLANALTYLGWTADFLLPTVTGFSNVVDRSVQPWGVGLAIAWLAGLGFRALRERGWVAAGASFALFLLPVLPLRHHTYHYYLTAPLLGAAWGVAAAADWALARRGTRVAWGIAGALALLLTLNGALLVRRIETMPFVLPGLRDEAIVDRARIARNVRDGIAAALPVTGDTLVFWSPLAASLGARGEPLAARAPQETYWERNLRDALLDGLAVRVMFPDVAAVAFTREFRPTGAATRYAVYRPDGWVRVATSAEVESAIRAGQLGH
ncbi:MAG: hypothetical protein E6K81_12245 [Candidatus Eisenbacteria bacterium]|uniref:Glycosyltransferase RgtA/B/C/D-like domain-containing protein n=1 Tax=Eiseniibacteriota bacterium TaxID=2212470 RepID=A0A538U3X1_UNCEI|nr:MAG: hypothetical protein E6K81_12245 [Candidatus Eisenbacteria bacterium]